MFAGVYSLGRNGLAVRGKGSQGSWYSSFASVTSDGKRNTVKIPVHVTVRVKVTVTAQVTVSVDVTVKVESPVTVTV